MRFHTRLLLPFALLALAGPALAQEEYLVRGADLAGRATVTEGETDRSGVTDVSVDLRFRITKDDDEALHLRGSGVRLPNGAIRWSYEAEHETGFARGMIRWIANPTRGRSAWDDRREEIEVALFPAGDGYRGCVAGENQEWTPLPEAVPQDELVVLAIPGLSTNNWNRVGIPYMDENLRALRAYGFEARRLKIKTEDSVATNAAFIAREIRAEAARGKRVVIFAHSKGGTDTTAALGLEPELTAHVAGVIAIQPVYGGSPAAEWVDGSRVLTGIVAGVFERVFKGSRDAVLDLTRETRAAFVADHPYPSDRVPTVVIRSTFDRKVGSLSVLWVPQKIIERQGEGASDGLVRLPDQSIPGAVATIDLDDLDHFEPGVRGESPHTPTEVTDRAIRALLPHLEADEAPRTQQAAARGYAGGALGN